jgi:hypothetical protein
MKKNMGNIDRAIRVLIALVVTGLFFGNIISGVVAYVLLGLSVVFVATSLISFCPLYTLFGLSSCPAEKS